MPSLEGFPVRLGGREKYALKTFKIQHGDLSNDKNSGQAEMVEGIEALGQRIEAGIMEALGPTAEKQQNRAEIIRQALHDPSIAQHVESVNSVNDDGNVIEIEFCAVGYPGAYIKRFLIAGPGGKYPVRTVQPPSATPSHRT